MGAEVSISCTLGPFEVASFEHFGLERPFNMAAVIVFTPRRTSEGDIYPVWNATCIFH